MIRKLKEKRTLKILLSIAAVSAVVVAVFLVKFGPTQALSGADFRAGRIIDDFNFTTNLTTVAQIQSLLNNSMPQCDTWGQQTVYDRVYGDTVTRATYGERRGNPPPFTCLKEYFENPDTKANNYGGQPIPAGAKSAAQLIWEAGIFYNINPQVLVVTLQKEQGLLTDDWPFKNQFLYAMGAHCPDSGPGGSANCDPAYAGFSIQMLEAARLLRYYLDNMGQPWWPYAKPGNRSILFNPSTACGSSNVFIENMATAALYTYTPYQPNQAALNNLYGTGDSCSAYGNRNFWRMYNDWFGPSTGEGYVLATSYNDNGDSRQWVVYQGIRRLVPDPATAQAWGLNNVTLLQWTGVYLGSVPESQPLTRLMRPSGSLDVYFVDSGKAYKVTSSTMLNAWDFNPAAINNVSLGLSRVPINSGNLSYAIRDAATPTGGVYLVDGGSKRHYPSPDILTAWEGDTPAITNLSNVYLSAMTTGANITGTKITDGSQEYQVVASQKLASSFDAAQLYPGVAQSVNSSTINRLATSSPVSHFVRASGSSTVYMVNASTKHEVANPNALRAWGKGVNPAVNVVTQGNINLLSNGAVLNTYQADVGGQLYLMDGRKIVVPSSLDSGYRTGSVFSASAALMNLLPSGENASNFIKSFDQPAVYLLDAATLRNIKTPNQLNLWKNNENITSVSNYVLNQLPVGTSIGAYVTNGTTEYIIQSGTKHSVSGAVKSNWGLSGPDTLAASTLNRFSSGTALSHQLQNLGKYYLVSQGKSFLTVDNNIAEVWGISSAPQMNDAIVSEFLTVNMMTRFVKSKLVGDQRLFVVDSGVLYHIPSSASASNLGLTDSSSLMAIDPESITASISTWGAVVVKNSTGTHYVIDGGGKRTFPSSVVQDYWLGNGVVTATQVTNGFLNLLHNRGIVDRAVKGSTSNIYAISPKGGVVSKHWITNTSTYVNNFGRYEIVSDLLLNALPPGPNIN